MKTITLGTKNYSITLRADDIVATVCYKDELNIYLRGITEPFALNNANHFDEWLNAIWEDND